MNKQSLFTILFTVLMSMTGAKAFAHDIAVANDDGVTIYYRWSNYNTELSVSYRDTSPDDYSNEYSGNVVIPGAVVYEGNTYSVTSIGGYAFSGCSGLTSVTIPNSVTSIGGYAFYDCSGLTSITIGSSVTSIGDYAFSGCIGLSSITIPNSVTTISYGAFYNCRGLTSVTIPNSVNTIGRMAFYNCRGMTSVTIPNSVNTIGFEAFFGTAWYDNQPDGLVYAGKVAYKYKGEMPANTHITIKDGTLGIADLTFDSCSGLTSVTIPNSVTSIGCWAFEGCSGLKSVTIPNSVTSIGYGAFSGCSGLTSVTIPNSVTTIEWAAFQYCSSLTSISIPNSVTSIGYEAFSGCSGLTSVVIGSGVTSIGSSAFSNTNLRKTIWLTNTPPLGYNYVQATVNYVSNEQFSINNKMVYSFLSSYFDVDGVRYVPVSPSERTCDAIDCLYDESAENINIGETVTYKGVTLTVKKVNPYTCYKNKFIKDVKLSLNGDIGNYAFYGCTAMESADLGQKVTSIGNYTFNECAKLGSIVIPNTVTSIGSYAFQDCSAMTSAQIGNGVETIYDYAFSNCSSIKQLKIGAKVKTINQYAFSGCSALPIVTIPAAVTRINNYVFYGCTSLKEVNIADSDIDLTLGSNGSSPVFSSCPLETVYIGRNINYSTSSDYGYSPFYRNTSLKTVSITDKETEISENEFYGCTNLQSITIGDGVTTIGQYAFSGCSSLKYFAFGSQVQTIGQEAFSDCAAMVEVISKAQNPPVCGSQALDDINKFECKLYVPNGYMAVYQAADQWKDFFFKEEGEGTGGQGGGINYGKCEAPTITLTGNKLSFSCPTEGAVIHYNISTPDVQNGVGSEEVNLTNTYTVSVYATKEGYEDSEVTTAELISSSELVRIGDTNGDGIITVSDVINLMDVILTTP